MESSYEVAGLFDCSDGAADEGGDRYVEEEGRKVSLDAISLLPSLPAFSFALGTLFDPLNNP